VIHLGVDHEASRVFVIQFLGPSCLRVNMKGTMHETRQEGR